MFTLYGETFPSRLLLGTAALSDAGNPQAVCPNRATGDDYRFIAPCRQRRRKRTGRVFGRYWKKWAYLYCPIPQVAKVCRKP